MKKGNKTGSRGSSLSTLSSYRKDPLMTICGKRGFPTEGAARSELDVCRDKLAQGIRNRLEQRVYPCLECGRWHLTSKEQMA